MSASILTSLEPLKCLILTGPRSNEYSASSDRGYSPIGVLIFMFSSCPIVRRPVLGYLTQTRNSSLPCCKRCACAPKKPCLTWFVRLACVNPRKYAFGFRVNNTSLFPAALASVIFVMAGICSMLLKSKLFACSNSLRSRLSKLTETGVPKVFRPVTENLFASGILPIFSFTLLTISKLDISLVSRSFNVTNTFPACAPVSWPLKADPTEENV